MNNKNIIIAGAIAVGLYFFSQMKKTAQRIRPTATPTIRQRTAQKVAQKIAQKVAQKVAPKRIGQPTTEAARIAALLRATAQKENIFELPIQLLRYLISHAAAQKKTGKEVAALRAEVVRREAAWSAAHKAAPKRIGQPTTQAARIAALRKAALRKAAVRKAAAQKIGKIIGKKAAQKVVPQILEETGGRTGMALVTFLQKKAAAMHAAATQAAQAVRKNSKIILPCFQVGRRTNRNGISNIPEEKRSGDSASAVASEGGSTHHKTFSWCRKKQNNSVLREQQAQLLWPEKPQAVE